MNKQPYAFQQLVPALARGTFRLGMMTDPRWSAEIKYDGDRRLAQFCGSIVRFTGRTISKTDGLYVEKTGNVPHLSRGEHCTEGCIRALDGTVLDGEMTVSDPTQYADRGGRSKHVTAIMGSLPGEAVRKQQERGWLRYVVFDCLFYRGTDVRALAQARRREHAAEALRQWANPYAELSVECPDRTAKAAWLEQLYAAGEEGLILKDTQAPYGAPQAWVKRKAVITADAFIVGYVDAKPVSAKRSGTVSATKLATREWIGALRLAQYRDGEVWECAAVSGMDDALRAAISSAPATYIGRVVELKANAREPTGRFRHPQFLRFRDDKLPADCCYRVDES